jgi:hypothetical protein
VRVVVVAASSASEVESFHRGTRLHGRESPLRISSASFVTPLGMKNPLDFDVASNPHKAPRETVEPAHDHPPQLSPSGPPAHRPLHPARLPCRGPPAAKPFRFMVVHMTAVSRDRRACIEG